jgi:hypothetical protein
MGNWLPLRPLFVAPHPNLEHIFNSTVGRVYAFGLRARLDFTMHPGEPACLAVTPKVSQ